MIEIAENLKFPFSATPHDIRYYYKDAVVY